MDAVQLGQTVFKFADAKGKSAEQMMSSPDFGEHISDMVLVSYQISMQGVYWQLAAGLVKEMSEPLKSIVNK